MTISYARLPVPIDISKAQYEIAKLSTGWKAHFNAMNYTGEWTALPLRSPGGNVDDIVPELIHSDTYQDTALLRHCPSIMQLLKSLKCETLSVRLLNLKQGAMIKEHCDAELAFERGEARLHFPIFTNAFVEFYIDSQLVTMCEGECWYINANRKHKVYNNGNTERIHLVVDCKVNEWLKELFAQAEKTHVPPQLETEDWDKIILQLRQLGTKTSLAMAAEMETRLKAI